MLGNKIYAGVAKNGIFRRRMKFWIFKKPPPTKKNKKKNLYTNLLRSFFLSSKAVSYFSFKIESLVEAGWQLNKETWVN